MAIQSSGLLARLLIAHRGEDYAEEWKQHFAPRIRAASVFAHLAMHAPTRFASLARDPRRARPVGPGRAAFRQGAYFSLSSLARSEVSDVLGSSHRPKKSLA